MTAERDFIPLQVCVLTVSDTRTAANDTSGDYLVQSLEAAGHRVPMRALMPDDRYRLRAIVAQWIADPEVDFAALSAIRYSRCVAYSSGL